MFTVTTPTGSIAIPVRVGDPLFSVLAQINPLTEDAPIHRSVVADLGLPGRGLGNGTVLVGEVLS